MKKRRGLVALILCAVIAALGSAFAAWLIIQLDTRGSTFTPIEDPCYLFKEGGSTYDGTTEFNNEDFMAGLVYDEYAESVKTVGISLEWLGVRLDGNTEATTSSDYYTYAGTHYYRVYYVKDGEEINISECHPYTVAKKAVTATVEPSVTSPLFEGDVMSFNVTFTGITSIVKSFNEAVNYTDAGATVINQSYEPKQDIAEIFNDINPDFRYNHTFDGVTPTYTGATVLPTCYYYSSSTIYFGTLNDAFKYLSDNSISSGTLVAMQSFSYGGTPYSADTYDTEKQYTHTVSGEVTVPSGVTFTIPYSSSGESFKAGESTLDRQENNTTQVSGSVWNAICANKISLAEGAKITNNGTMTVGGVIGRQTQGISGVTFGSFSAVVMGKDAQIVSPGTLNVFGYIVEEESNNGSTVNIEGGKVTMPFVVYDYNGGSYTVGAFNSGKMSPFNIFDMPNIHSRLYCNSSSTITAYASLYTGEMTALGITIEPKMNTTSFNILASSKALFIMGSGATAEFKYTPTNKFNDKFKPATDSRTEIKLSGNITTGDLSMTVSVAIITATVSLATVQFPVCHKFDVRLTSGGTYTMTSKYKFLPGSSLTVDSGATLVVNSNSSIIFYDGFPGEEGNINTLVSSYYPVSYRSSTAICNVGGTINVQGGLGGLITPIKNGKLTFGASSYKSVTSEEVNGGFDSSAILGDTRGGTHTHVDTEKQALKLPTGYSDILCSNSSSIYFVGERADNKYGWQPENIKVTFNANGGSVTPASLSAYCGAAGYTLGNTDLPIPTRNYYTFNHWCTDSSCQNGQSCQNAVKTGDKICRDITLYAKWTANTYTVTFKVDGATYDTRNITYGALYTFPQSPTKTGYTFSYWEDAAGNKITSSTKMLTGNHELYAVWTANVYNLTFYSDGAELADERTTVTYGDTYGTLPNLKKDGFIFEGWRLGSVDGIAVDANTEVTTAADHALYAKWKEATNTVTVTFMEGDTVKGTKTYEIGELYSEGGSLYTYTNTGHTLSWYTTSDFQDGTEITNATVASEDVTVLYAKWTANTYTVTLNADGTPSTFGTVTFGQTYGSAGTLPTPTKYGHTFVGWYIGDTAITADSTVNTAGNHTLVAKFAKGSYTVTFMANGTSFATSTVEFESCITLPTTNPTKTGYNFVGWYTAESGGSQVDASTVLESEGATYYAKWELKPTYTVTITWNKTFGSATITVSDGVIATQTGGTLSGSTLTGHVTSFTVTEGSTLTLKLKCNGATEATETISAIASNKNVSVTTGWLIITYTKITVADS